MLEMIYMNFDAKIVIEIVPVGMEELDVELKSKEIYWVHRYIPRLQSFQSILSSAEFQIAWPDLIAEPTAVNFSHRLLAGFHAYNL